MFLEFTSQQWALLLLAICIVPIAVLCIFAIIKTLKTRKARAKEREAIIEEEPIDVDQRKIFYEAYGGEENVLEITQEMSRITVKVLDTEKVNGERLKELGATGVLIVGDLIKASYSDRAKYVYKLMEKNNG